MTAPSPPTRRPRLIFLTQWFEPEPVPRGLAFATRMDHLGFDVHVVTGFPNYPGGKLYEGFRIRPILHQKIGPIAVTRLALYPSHNHNSFARSMNYLSFFFSTLIYMIFLAPRADVIYAYHPPITVGMTAALTRAIRRIPVVLDVQDMWPDTLRATGMISNPMLIKLIGAICRWTWRRMDHVVAQSDGFFRLLVERGVAPEKLSVIYNWASTEAVPDVAGSTPAAFADRSKFRILFAGNMGAAQALERVLEAARIVGTGAPQVEFCFLGDGI